MLLRLYKKLKSEKANTLLENVIILPLIIIVIYFMILASFVIHDHSTLDAAAKRGTIYAARCVSDPNYPMILQQSGHQSGTLDTNVVKWDADSFKGVGDNIKPYRYLVMNTADIRDATVNEVYNIIQQTKIPWREIETEDIVVKIDNKIIYQNVEVSITARYPLPQIFGSFGLPTEFNYTVSAVTAVNDPDEFIRNVDLIVDVCAAIDQKTGGNIQKVLAKLNDMGTRLTQFLSGEGGVGGSGGAGSNPGGGSGGGDEGDYIAGVGDNAGGDGGLESGENGGSGGSGGGDESVGTEEGDESGGTGEGGTEIAGNITPVVPIIVGEDKEEEEKPQESSDAAAEGTTEREEATPEQIRDSMIERFGQGTVDTVSEGVDTSTWTEYDWQFYITEYLQNGSLPGDWDAPLPLPSPSSTPEPTAICRVFRDATTQDADLVDDIRKKYDAGKGRNVAFASGTINGENIYLESISGQANRGNFEPPSPENYHYEGPVTEYINHTEQKIVEYLRQQYKDNTDVSGEIEIVSEREFCENCRVLVDMFELEFPNIKVVRVEIENQGD